MNTDHPDDKSIVFIRDIENVDFESESSKKAIKKFFDLTDDGKIDTEAQDLLNELKNEKIPSVLVDQNIIRFKVRTYILC